MFTRAVGSLSRRFRCLHTYILRNKYYMPTNCVCNLIILILRRWILEIQKNNWNELNRKKNFRKYKYFSFIQHLWQHLQCHTHAQLNTLLQQLVATCNVRGTRYAIKMSSSDIKCNKCRSLRLATEGAHHSDGKIFTPRRPCYVPRRCCNKVSSKPGVRRFISSCLPVCLFTL